jgi:hypothetical protein
MIQEQIEERLRVLQVNLEEQKRRN